jgi:hypothetical protein
LPFIIASFFSFVGIFTPSQVSGDVRQFGYNNIVPGLELYPLPTVPSGPRRPVGALETFVVELDEAQQTVRFQLTVARHLSADLPNGFAIVMNGGGMPGEGTAPIVVFDGSTQIPRITVARYMGFGKILLKNLFAPNGEILFSGDSSSPQVLLATMDEVGDQVSFGLELDISDFNSTSTSFPQWTGFSSTGDIGVWMDVFQNLSICYPFEATGMNPAIGVQSAACECENSDDHDRDDSDDDDRDDSDDDDRDDSEDDECDDSEDDDSENLDDDECEKSEHNSLFGERRKNHRGNESEGRSFAAQSISKMSPQRLERALRSMRSQEIPVEIEEPGDYCFGAVGRLDVHIAPFNYKPDCFALFLNGSGSTIGGLPSTSSGLEQFAIGEEVEIQGACITPDNSSSILEYPSLPDGAISSVASGSTVQSGDQFFFGIQTATAIPGDIFFIEFTCNGVTSYWNGVNVLPGNSCVLGFEVFDDASDEECEVEDNTSILFTLDGLSKDLDALNRRIARKAKKRSPTKRKRIRTLQSQSEEAAIDAWNIWVDLPTITYQCVDPTISILDHSGARFDYIADINELELIGKRLARILRKGGAEGRGKRFRRQVIELAELAREEAEKTPLQSSNVGL